MTIQDGLYQVLETGGFVELWNEGYIYPVRMSMFGVATYKLTNIADMCFNPSMPAPKISLQPPTPSNDTFNGLISIYDLPPFSSYDPPFSSYD